MNNKWYSLRVISGKEKQIKDRLELEINRSGWQDIVSQIIVPTEKVYKIRSGKKVIIERNVLPGYILLMIDADRFSGEIIRTLSNLPNVMHFLGRDKPVWMSDAEANRLLGKVDESHQIGEELLEPFLIGETIKITDGPFNGFIGDITEVNESNKTLKVIVKIFGRGTEVELSFVQAEKQS